MQFRSSLWRILIVLSILLAAFAFQQAQAIAEEECSSCHEVRHGGAQCLNCHWNASLVSGKHPRKPFVPASVHGGFDWEADDSNETNLSPDQESCPACHVNLREHTSQIVNTCEGCHVKGEYLAASTILLRSDIANFTPRVYSHYSNVSVLQNSPSLCFGFDASTGEGTCHGVNFLYKSRSGGYFAFNLNYTDAAIRSDIYHWTVSVDNLPDSNDCIFCHRQENAVIRKAWGNPKPLLSDSSHKGGNKDCLDCHVSGKFTSLHGKEIARVVEKSDILEAGIVRAGLTVSLSILIIIVAILLRKQKGR